MTKGYQVWNKMIQRCYDDKLHQKQITYKNCSVIEEWCNFKTFSEWFEKNYNSEVMQGWQLDKDILIKGNKIYSSETCVFVPKDINVLFTKRQNKRGDLPIGVIKNNKGFSANLLKNGEKVYLGYFKTPEEAFESYKTAKEKYIKEVADKWKDQISPRVYEAMYKYKVEITD